MELRLILDEFNRLKTSGVDLPAWVDSETVDGRTRSDKHVVCPSWPKDPRSCRCRHNAKDVEQTWTIRELAARSPMSPRWALCPDARTQILFDETRHADWNARTDTALAVAGVNHVINAPVGEDGGMNADDARKTLERARVAVDRLAELNEEAARALGGILDQAEKALEAHLEKRRIELISGTW